MSAVGEQRSGGTDNRAIDFGCGTALTVLSR